jgi:hypothetical protein
MWTTDCDYDEDDNFMEGIVSNDGWDIYNWNNAAKYINRLEKALLSLGVNIEIYRKNDES